MFTPKRNHGYVKKRNRYTYLLLFVKRKSGKNSIDRRRVRLPDAVQISQGLYRVNDRSCIGHWEADTVAGVEAVPVFLRLRIDTPDFCLQLKWIAIPHVRFRKNDPTTGAD